MEKKRNKWRAKDEKGKKETGQRQKNENEKDGKMR